MFQYRQVEFRNLGWRGRIGLVVGVALALALGIALVVLSLGLALILVPAVAVALLIGRWRLNRLMAEARARAERGEDGPAGRNRTIEIDYTVIDDDRR